MIDISLSLDTQPNPWPKAAVSVYRQVWPTAEEYIYV